jgi:O-antigen/teichoic acid export membrane protein
MTRSPVFIAAFLAAAVLGAAMICLDQVWVALGHGGNSAVRYASGGVLSVVTLSAVAVLTDSIGAVLLFACWGCGTLAATLLGAIQLRRLFGYRYRPALSGQRVRQLLGIGLPNHLLTLTERAPGLLIPILVAHAVSPRITAYWYPAWMMAWIVYIAPVQVGLVQFAEGVRRPELLAATVRRGIGWSLVLGGGIAVAMFVAARPLLRLLGSDYAAASVGAVRILVIGLVPYAFLQAYGAICRARGRLLEGIAFNTVLGAAICAGVVIVAHRGPTAMAAVWLAGSGCGAVWAALRIRRVLVEAA